MYNINRRIDHSPAPSPSAEPAEHLPSAPRPRIVWAEDSLDIQASVRHVLSQRYEVEAVSNGLEALAVIQRQMPDLVLSDVRMPLLDGLSLLHRLRADKQTGTLPVILISAHADLDTRIEGLEAGAVEYLTKPFSVRELLARISTQIELARLRREAEAARHREDQSQLLREQELRIRRTLDSMIEGCQIISHDWRYIYLNDSAVQHARKPREQLIGQQMMQAYPGIESTELFQQLQRCMSEQVPQRIENRFEYDDGTVAWFDLSIQPSSDGIFVLSIDITKRRSDEQELKSQANLLEQVSDAIISTDESFCIRSWNRGAEQLYGWPSEEVLGQRLADLVPATYLYDEESQVRATFLSAGRWQGEVIHPHRDGTPLTVMSSVSLLRDSAGKFIGAVGVNRDITERKRAEEQVRQLNAELEQRVATRTAELEDAVKELEAFSYSVSHDLRTPLRAIDGFSQILVADHAADLPAEAQRYLRRVRSNVQQMNQLIDDLLAFSRLSRQPLAKQTTDLNQLVIEALNTLPAEQGERAIELEINKLPVCACDPVLLKQVLINLLANALKYSRERSPARITVGAQLTDGAPIYYIRDNGVGFDMRYADKLFGVFQRLHRADEYEGTGVGLAIVQRIIHRHGGQIWAKSAVEQGATFFFTLGKE